MLTQGQLELSNTTAAITIDGPGRQPLTISGNNASRVFAVDEGVTATISGLTITAGSAPSLGGGLYGYGGGLDNESGSVTLTDCTISGNTHHEAPV